MAKYRKKPVVIDAFIFGIDNVPDWFMDAVTSNDVILHCDNDNQRGPFDECVNQTATIITLEGNHLARKGDYIIRGVKGELYPCKPDIFEMTYDSVNTDF